MRYMIARGWFADGYAIEDWLQGPRPIWTRGAWEESCKKLVEIGELSSDRPVALIHGKFVAFPHQQHEEAIRFLKEKAQEKESGPVSIVVGVDSGPWFPYGDYSYFLSSLLDLSLVAQIVDVDYIYPVLPGEKEVRNADDFYRSFYRLLGVRYLYVEDDPEQNKFCQDQIRRAEDLGIKVVSRRHAPGTHIDSSTISGFGPQGFDVEDEMEELEMELSLQIWPDQPERGLLF